MRRALLLFLGIGAITYFEFAYYPGHTYLAGESQNLVAMMKRLDQPGFLSRDLVATNPSLTYTIYDEVTLFLRRSTGRDFEFVLAAQQVAFRFAGVLGITLLLLAVEIKPLPALLLTALISSGIILPGIGLPVTDPEPTPFSYALGLLFLALGLLANRRSLLAGVCGGLALAYDATVGVIFWVPVFLGLAFQKNLRVGWRPILAPFLIFALLLANASQLQPGVGEAPPFLTTASQTWVTLQLARTPNLYLSHWPPAAWLFYLLLGVLWTLTFVLLKSTLPARLRFVLFAPAVCGLLALPLTLLLTEGIHWALVGAIQPARTVAAAAVCTAVAMSASATREWKRNRRMSAAWLIPVIVPVILLRLPRPPPNQTAELNSISTIARWAEDSTWGGSMFLFPDIGKSDAPGVFRGRSTRAVYADWIGGEATGYLEGFAKEWGSRWQQTEAAPYSPASLQKLLTLPVEYVVLRRRHALRDVRPELETPEFLVYDTHLLQGAKLPLRTVNGGS